nr:BRO family protein [uncultured Psychrobacter sp.]
MNTLTFNGNTLTTINQDNQIWLTASDLATALGYKAADSVTKVYNRNKEEFSENMSQTIETVKLTSSAKTKGLTVKTRIFSLRGCHLIAMFARTDIAKAFRVWVLDILDREVKTTSHQRTPLRQACDRLAVGNMLISDAYKIVSTHYNVDHIDQIPEASLPEAVAFVYDLILLKKKSSANNAKYIQDMHGIGAKKVEETRHALSVMQKALASLDCSMEVIKQYNETQASVFDSLKCQGAKVVN